MVAELTLENLEQGEDKLTNYIELNSIYRDQGKLELDKFYDKHKDEVPQRIFIVQPNEEINCDKYNYYHKKSEYIFATYEWKTYVIKIDSVLGCKRAVEGTKDVIYRVERKNRPAMEGIKNGIASAKEKGFSLFSKKTAPADASTTNNAPAAPVETPATSGGRKSRNQRKSRRSRKQRNQRKSRKQRRSRR